MKWLFYYHICNKIIMYWKIHFFFRKKCLQCLPNKIIISSIISLKSHYFNKHFIRVFLSFAYTFSMASSFFETINFKLNLYIKPFYNTDIYFFWSIAAIFLSKHFVPWNILGTFSYSNLVTKVSDKTRWSYQN